jgi:hypothetical protein
LSPYARECAAGGHDDKNDEQQLRTAGLSIYAMLHMERRIAV